MFKQRISEEIWGGDNGKYRLIDDSGNAIDKTPEDTCNRVARTLADIEPKDQDYWYEQFKSILGIKFAGGGRIMANVGSLKYKKEVSPINCVVMSQIPDSLEGIMEVAKRAALTLKAGCGVGYDFSTLRPKGAYVYGAGSGTSGVISFMKIFDAVCSTILSGGARRGAQMGCLDIQHPDIEDFISCKRQDGTLRYFNLSCLITNKFMNAVINDEDWQLWFWQKTKLKSVKEKICLIKETDVPFNHSEFNYFKFDKNHAEVQFKNCTTKDIFEKRIYKTLKAKELFELIMKSTYDFAEPGFLLIDVVNEQNNLYMCEVIRQTNPCGEQPLGAESNCLLGSFLLCPYYKNPFEENAYFDFDQLKNDVRVASRLLDNVVEVNNLPLQILSDKILFQRRHGMGFAGIGSLFNMMNIRYGSKESMDFAEKLTLILAQESLLAAIEIAKEKGCAPFCKEKAVREQYINSGYMKKLLDTFENKETVIADILEFGVRWSHATSIAPTGTMALSWGNNCSNGLEPVFSNSYLRNIRVPGKKTKVQEEVMDYAYMEWKNKFGDKELPENWCTTNNITVEDHVNVQSAIQKYIDSATSKTINVPVDYPFEDFKNVYIDGWRKGLKGITTFRFNPDVFSGVLVQKEDLDNTTYTFTLEDGQEVVFKGSDKVEYDGETHVVSNLFDALKEGIYGNM